VPNATFRAYWIVRNARTMTTERLMMRLKLAPMGLDPRVQLFGEKLCLRAAGNGCSGIPFAKGRAFWHRFPSAAKPPYIPIGRGCSSGVEHNLAKVGVEGSNPFARSKFNFQSQGRARSSRRGPLSLDPIPGPAWTCLTNSAGGDASSATAKCHAARPACCSRDVGRPFPRA
jgi:hypothetical protein